MANKNGSIFDTLKGAVDGASVSRVTELAVPYAREIIARTYCDLGRVQRPIEQPEHIGYYNAYINGEMIPLEGDVFVLTPDDVLDVGERSDEIDDALEVSHALMAPTDLAQRMVDRYKGDTSQLFAFLTDNEDVFMDALRDTIRDSDEYDAARHMPIEFRPAENRGSIAHAVGLGSRMEQIESEIMQALEEGCDPGAYQMPVMFLNSMFFWYANVREDGQVDALSFYKSREQLQSNFERKLKTAPLMLGTHADAEDSLLPYWNGDIQMNTGMSGNM